MTDIYFPQSVLPHDDLMHRQRVEQAEHFLDLDFEELAEERTDIDARKKIARAAGSLGRAGVVAELGIVKRQLHERGHRQWTALADALGESRFGIRDSGFGRRR